VTIGHSNFKYSRVELSGILAFLQKLTYVLSVLESAS